ncbi:DUF805 domain-containing protein [Psychroserpens sp. BH13MA-6]
MEWYFTVIRDNYANFSGRARRKEYWLFVLIQIGIFVVLLTINSFLDELMDIQLGNIIFFIYILGTLIPWLALNVRRLHDTGKSGAFIFINLIPLIGRIWYIVLMATNGDHGHNDYGADPKGDPFEEIEEIGTHTAQ